MYTILNDFLNIPENDNIVITVGCVVLAVGTYFLILYGFTRLIKAFKKGDKR